MKEAVLRHLEGKKNKRVHSWVMWKTLGDNKEAVLTGLSSGMFNLKELNDVSIDLDSLDILENEGETPSSKIFLSELVLGSEKKFSGRRKGVFRISSTTDFINQE